MTTVTFKHNASKELAWFKVEMPKEPKYCADYKENLVSCGQGRYKGLIKCACTGLQQDYKKELESAIASAIEFDRGEWEKVKEQVCPCQTDTEKCYWQPLLNKCDWQPEPDKLYTIPVESEVKNFCAFDSCSNNGNCENCQEPVKFAFLKPAKPENSAHSYTEGAEVDAKQETPNWTEKEYEEVRQIRGIVQKYNIGTEGIWEICKFIRSLKVEPSPQPSQEELYTREQMQSIWEDGCDYAQGAERGLPRPNLAFSEAIKRYPKFHITKK